MDTVQTAAARKYKTDAAMTKTATGILSFSGSFQKQKAKNVHIINAKRK